MYIYIYILFIIELILCMCMCVRAFCAHLSPPSIHVPASRSLQLSTSPAEHIQPNIINHTNTHSGFPHTRAQRTHTHTNAGYYFYHKQCNL